MLQYVCGSPSSWVEYEYKMLHTSVYHHGRRDQVLFKRYLLQSHTKHFCSYFGQKRQLLVKGSQILGNKNVVTLQTDCDKLGTFSDKLLQLCHTQLMWILCPMMLQQFVLIFYQQPPTLCQCHTELQLSGLWTLCDVWQQQAVVASLPSPPLLLFIRRFTVPDDETEVPLTRTIPTGSQPSHFRVLELKSGTFFIQQSFYMSAVPRRNRTSFRRIFIAFEAQNVKGGAHTQSVDVWIPDKFMQLI